MGSNAAGGMDVLFSDYYVLSGGGVFVGPITRPEESYRMLCLKVIMNPR